jgi:hypothetical protein
MQAERETLQINLERLNEFFPNKELLSISDVARFTGRTSEAVKKFFNFKGNYISKAEVARTLS